MTEDSGLDLSSGYKWSDLLAPGTPAGLHAGNEEEAYLILDDDEHDPEIPVLPLELPAKPVNAAKSAGKPAAEDQAPKGKYREVWAVVTAYCPCARCCRKVRPAAPPPATAPGSPASPPILQAIPYGTRVYVPGYGDYTIDDTGGAMRRSWRRDGRVHVDIRMTYHWQAKDWGRRLMKIRVYN